MSLQAMTTSERLLEVKRLEKRLRAAKQRALYWSGNPSFTGKRYRVAGGWIADLEYEMALNDIASLSRRLEELDGRPRRRYDPKADFRRRFSKAMERRGKC